MTRIRWDATTDVNMTHLRGYFTPEGLSFEETVARLITLSQQDPTEAGDSYKVSVEFMGVFAGEPFTLYDYKGGMNLHIGGHDTLDVAGLEAALEAAIRDVEPTPYQATIQYDRMAGAGHGFPR